jgi:hypothetical protein
LFPGGDQKKIVTERTKRTALATLLPGVFQILLLIFAAVLVERKPGEDQSLLAIAVMSSAIVIGSLILRPATFNHILKTYAYSCFASALPWIFLFTGIGVLGGTGGYFWLGAICFAILMIIAIIVSFPVVLLFSIDYRER